MLHVIWYSKLLSLFQNMLPGSENCDFIITVRTTNHVYKMWVPAAVDIPRMSLPVCECGMLADAIIACLLFAVPIS
jgi:hypothetical protein